MLAAIEKGDVEKLAELIRQDPGFDVNKDDDYGRTLLHHACLDSRRSAVIPLLLAHPDVDVNLKDTGGRAPLFLACYVGRPSCVREMLKDSRGKVNDSDRNGYTPLRYAYYGELDIIKWWIASRREMNLGKPGDVDGTDAIGVARRTVKQEVVALLERFKSDAVKTRHAARVELGWYEKLAAEMFALVVFVSDGLLQIKDTTPSPAARYFSIATQLPLELQMVLCFRQVGSAKEIIPGTEREAAFKELARRLW